MNQPRSQSSYRLIVSLTGLFFLFAITTQSSPAPVRWEIAGITTIFVVLLATFHINPLIHNGTLVQVLTIGIAALYDPVFAAWTTTLGLVVAWALGLALRPNWGPGAETFPQRALGLGYSIGVLLVPLGISIFLLNNSSTEFTFLYLADTFILALLFGLVHGLLLLGDRILRGGLRQGEVLRILLTLSLYELLPLPFILLAVITFPENQIGALIALGGIPSILAVLLQGSSNARQELERKIRDLSTLNRASRKLRSTLDLDQLLWVFQEQLTEILAVKNTYIALLDRVDQKIWFPLVVEAGAQTTWPRRPLDNGWTDQVILQQEPLLITRDREGLPEPMAYLEKAQSWIGVPLLSAEKSLGCLAVFSTKGEPQLDKNDLELLATLSGQVSMAIENALLYQEAQEKARQLEKLNQISTTLSGTLDFEEVLIQVCLSAAELSDGQASAIYLIDEELDQVHLAQSNGLSEPFYQENHKISTTQDDRTICLRIGQVSLTSDIQTLDQDNGSFNSFLSEGIKSFADFPLSTPGGRIGYLSVYFESPQQFPEDQVELLETFSSQAALAIHNARRFGLTDMALSRRANQLSILESIGRELAAATHSERLFELILDHALDFTNSPWGCLYLIVPETRQLEIKATRGYRQFPSQMLPPSGILARVVRTQETVNLGDIRQEPEYKDHTGGAARSQLSVPLIHEGRVLGVLLLESPTLNAFTENDQVFIGQLATQAAIALVNASLYSEARQRLENQASLYQVSKALVGNLEIGQVLQIIVQAIDAALESTASGVYLWDSRKELFCMRKRAGTDSKETSHLPDHFSRLDWENSKTTAIGTGLLRVVRGLTESGSPLDGCPECQTLMMPLAIGDRHIGAVLAHLPAEANPDESEMQLARSITTQGAIAVQNALLFTDVTESKDRLEVVLNSVEEGVLMVDANDVITLANATLQRIAGVPTGDLLGKRLPDLPVEIQRSLGFEDLESHSLLDSLSQIPPPKVVVKSHDQNQEQVIERFSAPVWGQNREIISWVFVLRDISEEHQLTQTRKLITDTLVHDLRSPVGAVSSALVMLEDALPAESQDDIMLQSLDIAKRSTKRVLSLIEALLDISRMESGHIELELTTFKLQEITGDLIADLKPQANIFGIVLANKISPDTPPVRADRDKVTRVIVNLLDNALKFTPEGGRISISTETLTPQTIAVKVRDTGPGVPEDFREKIFDRFSQVPGYPGRRRGSGIGLTFCRMAIEAHGENIWVDSPAEGGSVFSFSLPISREE